MGLPSLSLLGQSVLSGVFIGALYGLLGLGLSLSWGLLRQINLAHFALAFLAAYLCYQLSTVGGVDPLVTLVAIVPGFFLLGVALQWVFSRFEISAFNSLLVTFGLTVIVESVIQSIWTADFRRLESVYGNTRFRLGTLYVPAPELLTLVLSLPWPSRLASTGRRWHSSSPASAPRSRGWRACASR
jgi:branched-chain amino acid transport system permease protein